MSRITDEHGILCLKNREGYFKNGIPVNMPYWDKFKKIPALIENGGCYGISHYEIEQCFNPIYESFGGGQLHSSQDRFKVWCIENNLNFFEHSQNGFTVSKKS